MQEVRRCSKMFNCFRARKHKSSANHFLVNGYKLKNNCPNSYMPSVMKKRSMTRPSGIVETFTLRIKCSSSQRTWVTSTANPQLHQQSIHNTTKETVLKVTLQWIIPPTKQLLSHDACIYCNTIHILIPINSSFFFSNFKLEIMIKIWKSKNLHNIYYKIV